MALSECQLFLMIRHVYVSVGVASPEDPHATIMCQKLMSDGVNKTYIILTLLKKLQIRKCANGFTRYF